MKVFVDTSAFIAYSNAKDHHHKKIVQIFDKIAEPNSFYSTLLTSYYVVDETLTRLRYHQSHQVAVEWCTQLFRSEIIEIIIEDLKLINNAWNLFKKYKDKKLSFTDCVIAAIYLEKKLDGIICLDEDFKKLGFHVIP